MVETSAASSAAESAPRFVVLPQRGVLGIGGRDARDLLQNIISNDVHRLGPTAAMYALLLTPQGKYLHDFFLAAHDDAASSSTLVLDVERERIADLIRRLTLYKLRSEVTLTDVSDRYAVVVAFGRGAARMLSLRDSSGSARALGDGVAFVDPRLGELGARAILLIKSAAATLAGAGFAAASVATYDGLRLRHGVPDASRDMIIDKTFPLEAGLDALHAIDYDKGCYVGQELTARTHYRGTIRKRLMPVQIDGPVPEAGTPVLLGDVEAGEMRSAVPGVGLAFLRLEHVETAERTGAALKAGSATLRAVRPAWFNEPIAGVGQQR
jgi:folate-binding protein YgfZ